jgi:hypothetical protein
MSVPAYGPFSATPVDDSRGSFRTQSGLEISNSRAPPWSVENPWSRPRTVCKPLKLRGAPYSPTRAGRIFFDVINTSKQDADQRQMYV